MQFCPEAEKDAEGEPEKYEDEDLAVDATELAKYWQQETAACFETFLRTCQSFLAQETPQEEVKEAEALIPSCCATAHPSTSTCRGRGASDRCETQGARANRVARVSGHQHVPAAGQPPQPPVRENVRCQVRPAARKAVRISESLCRRHFESAHMYTCLHVSAHV